MAKADVQARDLLEEHGQTEAPVDPEFLAQKLGITVVSHGGRKSIYGMLLNRNEKTVIGINPEHSRAHQRFILAHLVGHHVLHARREILFELSNRAMPETEGYRSCLALDREEAEANRFATALLMPERLVRRASTELRPEKLLKVLPERFEVSPAVMSHRLISLGITLGG